MRISGLYAKYEIMPELATHMLRVAGVGKIITESWQDRELARKSVLACLVHDLGNLAKFKLEPKYQAEWGPKQVKLWERWGHDAHDATYGILRELGLDEYVGCLLAEAEFYAGKAEEIDMAKTPKPALIVLYADLRVAINGVVTLEERIEDLKRRYQNDRVESRWGKSLEEYMQTLTTVNLQSITEESVTPFFDELLAIQI